MKELQCEEVRRLNQDRGYENREVKLSVTFGENWILGISWGKKIKPYNENICEGIKLINLRHFKLEGKQCLVVGNKPD